MRHFMVVAGSIIGREHVRLSRNNQDGVGINAGGEMVVAAVTDGCSSCRGSEVGARLAAEWIANSAPRYLAGAGGPGAGAGAGSAEVARSLVRGLLAFVARTAAALSAERRISREVVNDWFLFTLLVAVIDRERAFVFGVGDGVFAVNGRVRVLDSGEDNAPRYAAYALLGSSELELDPGALDPIVHWEGKTEELQSLLIATDGAADLDAGAIAQLVTEPHYDANPTLLHKRLAALGDRQKRLRVDTTVVLIRRSRDARGPRDARGSDDERCPSNQLERDQPDARGSGGLGDEGRPRTERERDQRDARGAFAVGGVS